MLERHIDCEGVFNLRDLGGYRTIDRRSVRWRTVFRADGLHRCQEAVVEIARTLGWRTVIDLRTVAETRAARLECEGVAVLHLPILRTTWEAADFDKVPDADSLGFLTDRYLEMADEGAPSIAVALTLLGAPPRLPAVFHCAAGKDRTGVVAALVLATLGVPDDVIAEDYELSNRAMRHMMAWISAVHPDAAAGVLRQPAAFLECPGEAILGFLEGLRHQHGSVARYLDGIGVDQGKQEALRNALLV